MYVCIQNTLLWAYIYSGQGESTELTKQSEVVSSSMTGLYFW